MRGVISCISGTGLSRLKVRNQDNKCDADADRREQHSKDHAPSERKNIRPVFALMFLHRDVNG